MLDFDELIEIEFMLCIGNVISPPDVGVPINREFSIFNLQRELRTYIKVYNIAITRIKIEMYNEGIS